MICSCSKLWQVIISTEKAVENAVKKKRMKFFRMSHMQNNLCMSGEMVIAVAIPVV